ncbi:hypothetical protein AALA61_16305, partial [Oscillospiraceae bacterium 42-9]
MNCSRNTARRVKIRCPISPWPIAKYAALTLFGFLLLKAGAARALADRGYQALGGEVFALFIPVLSAKSAGLLPLSRLRTVRDSFPSYGS